MLFNSLEFIFIYVPVVLTGYYALSFLGIDKIRLSFIVLASLFFYGYWAPEYTPLLITSVVLNYILGLYISRKTGAARQFAVILGVSLNLLALGYFKYANFFVDNVNLALATDFHFEAILLPLAISFYTFQQMAFLIDLGRERIKLRDAVSYCAFVIFFPQLIAGPIVQYQELTPQLLKRPQFSRALENLLIGLAIFSLGLAKKTILADSAALYASPVFDAAHDGVTPGLLAAWGSVLAYTLQVYFDFSGYSDMAVGLARMFGVKLPLNFHMPLRAENIAELWRRWHMTLSRFVQSYIYQPLAVALARRSAMRGHGRWKSLALGTLAPTFLAMVIIGVWHGAGWTFVLFGAMHGTYLVIYEIWRTLARKRRGRSILPNWAIRLAGGWRAPLLTLLAFAVATVPFRADGMAAAMNMFAGMVGLGSDLGTSLSVAAGVTAGPEAAWPMGLAGLAGLLAAGYAIVYLLPSTQQIMGRCEPVLSWEQWKDVGRPPISFSWRPTMLWAILTGVTFTLATAFISRGTTEFIYFNF